jgi:CDGSH-type Zn-finger protein
VQRDSGGTRTGPLRSDSGPRGSPHDHRREDQGAMAPHEDEPAVITPYRDGPLLVRGPFRLVDQDGREIEVARSTVALCRCGKSRLRPFCDGTHKLSGFSAPSAAEDRSRRAAG